MTRRREERAVREAARRIREIDERRGSMSGSETRGPRPEDALDEAVAFDEDRSRWVRLAREALRRAAS